MQNQEGGAPADFNGPVFPNPDHIQISDDSDSGIPDLRLPNGVSATTGAYNGTPKLDTSNPASAQVLPAAMQTVASNTSPVTLDMSTAQPISAPVTLDMSTAKPIEKKSNSAQKEEPGILDREIPLTDHWNATLQGLQNIARGGKQAVQGAYEMGKLPTNKEEWAAFVAGGPIALAAYRSNKGLVDTAKGAAQVPGAIHDINQSADPTGTYMQVAGRTAGEGGGQALVALATEGAGKVAPEVASKVAPALETAKDAAATAVNKTAKAVKMVDPDVVGIVSPRAAHTLKVAQRAAKVVEKYTPPSNAAAARVAPESIVEDLEGVTSPQTESAGETPAEQVSEETAQPKNAVAARANVDTSPKNVSKLLKDATGAAPEAKVVPGVKIKNQPVAQAAKLPEGFTPTPESSHLKGYKYDPATQEFDAITQTGARYRHGGVSPEQFAKFEAADSKGAAWNSEIKNGAGVAPLGKVDAAGKVQPRVKPQFMRSVEVDPETGQPMFSDELEAKRKNLQDFITPEKKAGRGGSETSGETSQSKNRSRIGEDDLLSKLQQSVKQAKGKKGGVLTNADPKMLADRWGVTEESLKAGREQTRGWQPMETEAELKKLESRYRKGEPVEPVMETRDKDNNLIDVDGRGRAIAAKRAGVKRIPVIVRRLQ